MVARVRQLGHSNYLSGGSNEHVFTGLIRVFIALFDIKRRDCQLVDTRTCFT